MQYQELQSKRYIESWSRKDDDGASSPLSKYTHIPKLMQQLYISIDWLQIEVYN